MTDFIHKNMPYFFRGGADSLRTFENGLALIAPWLLGLMMFWSVLFADEQFAYRDAGHFYYPLYQKVQDEWDAGRWPLWEIEENAGMPLLGNPTAAVMYPGKLIYAALPYPWAARIYTIAHVLLAYYSMFFFSRSMGASATGSMIAGLGYAFGTPILFQYCNIIFLVGAAWAPLGFWATYAWLVRHNRWGIPVLVLALAMEVLGGDPQIAYLTGLCGIGLALGQCWGPWLTDPRNRKRIVFGTLFVITVWIGVTFVVAAGARGWRSPTNNRKIPGILFPQSVWLIRIVWLIALTGFVVIWRRRPELGRSFRRGLWGLTAAGVLAGALTAIQLMPVLEFSSHTTRAAAGGPHDIYPFSNEPYRIVECIWPNVMGKMFEPGGQLIDLLPPRNDHQIWIPSLYMGLFPFLLGMSALALRRGETWRIWLTWILLLSLLASLGKYGGPLYWVRLIPEATTWVGPQDPRETTAIRMDGYLRDGDGGFYWALAKFLPGFGTLRYPGKMFTLTAFACCALAGFGGDKLREQRERLPRALKFWWFVFMVLTLSVLSALLLGKTYWLGMANDWKTKVGDAGKYEPTAIFGYVRAGLIHAAILLALGVIAAVVVRSRNKFAPWLATPLALLLVGGDLYLTGHELILTLPQDRFEGVPKYLQVILDAEKQQPSSGPYRIHREPIWHPLGWTELNLDRRAYLDKLNTWERDTIQPKYGINFGTEYTYSIGTSELYDYAFFFGSWYQKIGSTAEPLLKAMGLQSGQEVVYTPRRCYDLWNTRYFIVPAYPGDWKQDHRGYLSFLDNTEQIYPAREFFQPTGDKEADSERKKEWIKNTDVQIFRNLNAYPRSWIVHEARRIEHEITALDREKRKMPMEEISYQNDWIWSSPGRELFNPKTLAWLEYGDFPRIRQKLSGGPSYNEETVVVHQINPERVELSARLSRPGLVILADAYYPGWELTVDGAPAEILRVNRMMRGAFVESGEHTLVYSYNPPSFRYGMLFSVLGFAGLGLACVWSRKGAASPIVNRRDSAT